MKRFFGSFGAREAVEEPSVSSRGSAKFHLHTESERLKVGDLVDYEKVIADFAELQRPDPSDADAVKAFNQRYIELYKPYDNSLEFRSQLELGTFNDTMIKPRFDELTVEYPQLAVPYLDQPGINTDHLAPHQQFWADNGFLLMEGMISPEVCDEYLALRQRLNLGTKSFADFVPYQHYDVIKQMFCSAEMHGLIVDLIGEELGIHFNLTPFVSTERGWHQDEYLNPPDTFGRYVAVWIAVDDVPETSGPFEFIRGSHKLPTVSKEKVMPYLKEQFQAGAENRQDWSVH